LSTNKFTRFLEVLALALMALCLYALHARASQTIYAPGVSSVITGTDVGGKKALDVNVVSSITATNASIGALGAAPPSSGTLMGGSDGALLRALKVDSTGVVQTNRTWTLLDSGDSVQASQKGAWIVGRTWTLGSGTDSIAAVQSGTWSNRLTDGTNTATVTASSALKVDGSAVTQPVSGTFWQATQPVSGTFWQATQPVSAASLPLPTGASTAAKQPALGTAGTPSSDVITVQGAASMTALKVDGSAVTQPVSFTSKAPVNTTGSGSAAAATVSTVITLTAPANAVGFVLQNLDTSTANLRWSIGRTATTTLGQQLQPGRDTGFIPAGANVSLVAESGTQNYDVQWVSQ
jgi:hypothetical protein